MTEIIEFIKNNILAFDIIVFLIIIYSVTQCTAKGFTRSLLSFSKWLLAFIITIILVPKLNPLVEDYIKSEFVADIGLGVFIYIVSLFIIINIAKIISGAVTWSGLGSVDKIFGLFFGIFKGYIVCVCIFTLFNCCLFHGPMCGKRIYEKLIIFFKMDTCFAYNNIFSAKIKSLGTRLYRIKIYC